MKKLFFDSPHQWWECMRNALLMTFKGLCKIIYALIFGVLSVLRWLWRLLVKAVGNYPKVAIIVATAAFIIAMTMTYACMKAQVASAEFQRDSMTYRLKKYETMYDGNTDSLIIVRSCETNDTLTFNGNDDD